MLVNRAESGEGESDYRAIYLILAIGQIAILTLFESGSESKSGSLGLANHTYHSPHNRMQAADLNLTLRLLLPKLPHHGPVLILTIGLIKPILRISATMQIGHGTAILTIWLFA